MERLLCRDPETDELIRTYGEMKFFNRQVRNALRNVGLISPVSIEEYIARDGYKALGKALTSMTRRSH